MDQPLKPLHADTVSLAFNKDSPASWKARPYMKSRTNGVFNACKFTYKNGMLAILMDCAKPLGDGFQVQFHNYTAAFGDYVVAIQKAMYYILKAMRDSGIDPTIPAHLAAADIAFSLRKDGSIIYLALINPDGTTRLSGNKNDEISELL